MFPPNAPSKIGRYEIKGLLGAGGMGVLYLARDTNPNTYRLVALKLLNASLDDELRERFGREARALAALNHSNVVQIYDSGEFQRSPYIVMEYLRGETLAEKIKRKAPQSLGRKLRLMADLCAGLAHAHEVGTIHRDIKPANLMVDWHGRLKLLDFGIARADAATRFKSKTTRLNIRIGTPGYMSPEQIEGGDIDRRSDLFAVGAVLYELLSYREAFAGNTTRQIESKVLHAQPVPLRSFIPDLTPEIDDIVTKGLAKNPVERFQSAPEFERALERALWHLPESDRPEGPRRDTPPAQSQRQTSHQHRARVAYERARAAYDEGAVEAAERSCIEALAEDPDHAQARALIEKIDPPAARATPPPSTLTPLPPTMVVAPGDVESPVPEGPTIVSTGARDGGDPRYSPTVVSMRAHAIAQRLWHRHGQSKWLIAGGASLLVVLIGVGVATLFVRGGSPSVELKVVKPTGGTISANGIKCGTRGSDCSVNLAQGEAVQFEIEADNGFRFAGYIGDCAPNGRITMSAARTCGATFEEEVAGPSANPAVHLLDIAKPAGGTVIGTGIKCGTQGTECSIKLQEGSRVALEGWADKGFTFQGFTGDCSQSGGVEMTKTRTCGATFTPNAVIARETAPNLPSGSSRRSGRSDRPSTGEETGGTSAPAAPERSDEKSANPPPPPAPKSPEVLEKEAKQDIEELLERFRLAYERLDLEAVRRPYPGAPAAFSFQFKQLESMRYSFTGAPTYVAFDLPGGAAIIERRFNQSYARKAGGSGSSNGVARFELQKRGADDAWVIVRYGVNTNR